MPLPSVHVLVRRSASLALAIVLLAGAPIAQAPPAHPRSANQAAPVAGPAIRLVLLIAVDQFRPDYLARFGAPQAGLRTLLTRGAVFTSAYLEHGITVTAVGHSTMLTGATPAVSGIVENSWYERATKTTVESITDTTVQIVGAERAGGVGASPRRLLVPTLGDQIKLASQAAPGTPQAPRVIGISLKDRSAILPSGHAADAAYFFRGGRFVTSTYYRPALPAWVEAVNARRIPDAYAGKQWTFEGGAHTYPATPGAALDSAVAASPAGNELVLAMAAAALEHEQLGQRRATDVLTVSFSANDSVGHTYGPDSPEVRDITHHVDRQLQRLLDEVDRRVGLSHTLIAFTADHGVAPKPEVATALRIPGGRFTASVVFDAIEAALQARYGAGPWIEKASLTNLYLDLAKIDAKQLDRTEVRRVAAEAAAGVPHVARVYTRDAILTGAVPREAISERITRAYHRERSGDLIVLLEPHWIAGGSTATHGTPYGYDAHVPLILMGPGIVPGRYRDRAALNDLAPTLAAVLDVEPPSGASGRVLSEALRADAPPSASRAPAATAHTAPGRPRTAP